MRQRRVLHRPVDGVQVAQPIAGLIGIAPVANERHATPRDLEQVGMDGDVDRRAWLAWDDKILDEPRDRTIARPEQAFALQDRLERVGPQHRNGVAVFFRIKRPFIPVDDDQLGITRNEYSCDRGITFRNGPACAFHA